MGELGGSWRTRAWLERARAEVEPHRRAIAIVAGIGTPWALWLGGIGWRTPALLHLAVLAAALSIIDARTHRLPDAITLPSYPIVAGLLSVASAGTGDWAALARAGIGGIGLWLAYLTLSLLNPSGMGYGDVKLAGLLGAHLAWAGWPTLLIGAISAFFLGAAAGLALIAIGRATGRTAIPFGPFMLLGAILGLSLDRLPGALALA